MDIGFYIADLLLDQDEVSLPGLGTFTKERIHGSYDQLSNSFRPPAYQISFTNKLSDFSSLSNYISFKKNLSSSSAEYFVKKFTSGIFDVLQTSGIVEVKPLGIIRQTDENLTFEASAAFSIAGKFYGLKPVSELKSALAPVIDDVVIPPAALGGSIEDFITGLGDGEHDDEEVSTEAPKSSRILLLILGALLFAVIAAILLYLFNPKVQGLVDNLVPGYSSTTPTASDPGIGNKTLLPLATDSARTNLTNTVKDSLIVDSVSGTKPEENKPKAIVVTNTIEIIGAAFGKRHEAEIYVVNMKKRGMQARILEDMPGPLFKVSLASFPDLQSAQPELNRIKKEVEKEAWPTTYKSKKTN